MLCPIGSTLLSSQKSQTCTPFLVTMSATDLKERDGLRRHTKKEASLFPNPATVLL